MIITKLQVAPVELDVSSESSCALRLAGHSQNAWARHVECVESSRAKWNLSLSQRTVSQYASSLGNRADCYAKLAVSSHAVTETIVSIHFTDPWREARLSGPDLSGLENTGMVDPSTVVTNSITNRV